MFGLQDNYRLGAPFGFPLLVNRFLLLWVGIYFVFGLVSKQAGYVIWLPIVFVSVYLHELGHAFATRRLGGRVEGITLHVFGGLTHTRGVRGARASILVSVAGPAVSIALGILALILARTVDFGEGLLASVVLALVFVNLLWGVFNLFPIYPLDGGHVLLAAISRRMSPGRALGLSAGVSLGTVLATAALAVALRAAGWLPVDLLFLGILLLFLGWLNVQRWRQVAQVRAATGRVSRSLGFDRSAEGPRSPGAGGGPSELSPPALLPLAPRPPRCRPAGATGLRELAEDEQRMGQLLRRGLKAGFGELDPRERRLLLFHRNILEERLARGGFEKLSSAERELLALHHELEDRSPQ